MIVHYNKFLNLGVYLAKFFPIWKTLGPLTKIAKKKSLGNPCIYRGLTHWF